ncbi:uncharacterized protein LOC126560925 [Anopheles maculipalpis]|uniref:uncharacterized protein LOC126560925 n=1 Tax=Anopheles maculipalpis TaxID=1496333 RepID=UPI002158A75E|nr:uncharacterized protein LOC126560925 [Anopheles maculipalpis]
MGIGNRYKKSARSLVARAPSQVTFICVLGLEFLLLGTHAHTAEQSLVEAASAQDSIVLPVALSKDKSPEQHPPSVEAKTDERAGKSVVVNWKLACKQLCSAGLGGPSCGSTWLRTTTTNPPELPVDKDTLAGVCPALCGNGLGVSKCKCKSYKPKPQFNQNLICESFCTVANVQLTGCSSCDGTDPSQSTLSPMGAYETTTPNWDELCSMFCKMGDGGTLCNCDLPPFF